MEHMERSNHSSTGRRRTAALVACGTVLAVAAVVYVQREDTSPAAQVAAVPATTGTPSDPARPERSPDAERPDARLPDAQPKGQTPQRVRIPDRASGRFRAAPGRSPEAGRGTVLRYTVAVERGLPYAVDEVAPIVEATLSDPRGWTRGGRHAFQRVPARPDIRVLLASPDTTDELCAPLQTRGQVSCRNGALVVLNARRWAYGIPDYEGDLRRYRQYVVNHEVGHALGAGHVPCPGRGRLAPLMQQQSHGLDGCRPNPWPR